jgi:hypothetical protein
MLVIYDLVTFCRNLRELFKIDAADYMMSICGNDALRELSSPGKSGSVFFLSQDDRFMIKTLRRSEVKVCLFCGSCSLALVAVADIDIQTSLEACFQLVLFHISFYLGVFSMVLGYQ